MFIPIEFEFWFSLPIPFYVKLSNVSRVRTAQSADAW